MSCLFKADLDIGLTINEYVGQLLNGVNQNDAISSLSDDLTLSQIDGVMENINASHVNYLTHLRSLPLEHHKVVWITTLSTITCESNKILKFITNYGEKYPERDLSSITLQLCQTFLIREEIQLGFLKQSNTIILDLVDLFNGSGKLFDQFINFINAALKCTQNSLPVDNGLLDNSASMLRKITNLIKKLYLSLNGRKTMLSSLFTTIVNLLECMYECDQSHLVLELIDDILYPELPLRLSKDSKIGLNFVLDYYIYISFNLFSLSFNDASIDNEMAKKADLYFKIFLNFPPSSYYLYVTFRKSPRDRVVYQVILPEDSDEKRKAFKRIEVSVLFVLNKILMARDLDDVISFSSMVNSELETCHRILSGVITLFLNVELERPDSASSISTVVDQERAEPSLLRSNTRSIGSIIHNGSYKERLFAVIKLMEQLMNLDITKFGKCFSLDSDFNSDFKHLHKTIENSPGRVKYFKLVNLVSKYLKLLSLKFLVKSVGSNEFSLSKLKDFLDNPASVQEILEIKPLLNYEVSMKNNEEFYKFSINEMSLGTQQDMVNHQLELAKQINGLESILEGNVYEMTKK
ncbi:hypothetical protein CLIB1444_01S05622 [[Candida] jaroonii]|uniref:Uncharacterized protein n=1 Tax=[Candida] jaroonii TaxID=467808 RepID=A0ACA9Y0I2_9ASCO|nr:hypothetical protein CLIB1444_01S05622 [[Candida] jaroonii]